MRDKCNRCKYSTLVNVGSDGEMMRACLYILREHEKRPCPAGEGCTVYAPKTKVMDSVSRHQWADKGGYI